jgi:hypothetical protein
LKSHFVLAVTSILDEGIGAVCLEAESWHPRHRSAAAKRSIDRFRLKLELQSVKTLPGCIPARQSREIVFE